MSEDGQLIPDSEGQGAAGNMPPPAAPEPGLPGKRLREEREARGISLGEVAHALKFSPRQVEALEADDYSSLQGSTFQRGFIRSYARYLKLDAAPLLAMLDVAAPPVEAEIVAPSNMGTAVSQPFIERNQKWVLIGLALVAATAIGAYLLTKDQGIGTPSTKTEPEPAAASQPAPQPEAQPTVVAPTPVPLSGAPATGSDVPAQAPAPAATPSPTAPATPAPSPSSAVPALTAPSAMAPAPAAAAPAQPNGQKQLVLDFDGRSWVEVKDGTQKVVFTGEYGAGTHQVINGKPPFQLWIGKASVVRVNYNEQKVNLQPHARDEVARLTLE